MNTEFKDGRLSFNFSDLLDRMSDDEKKDLIELLSCDSAVVTFVSQQIIDRWTDSGSHGRVYCIASDDPRHGLDKAWRDVAKASGDIAKREIERLETALKHQEEATAWAWDEYHKAARARRDRGYA